MIDIHKLGKSFRYAMRGFWYVFKNEQNIIQITNKLVFTNFMIVLYDKFFEKRQ